MKVLVNRAAALLFALLAGAAAAQPNSSPSELTPGPAPAGLQANDRARILIEGDPRVVQARRGLDAARERGVALTVGPNEWTAKAGTQRRRYQSPGGSVNEWSVGIERSLRLGGKAGLDRSLGEMHVVLAEAKLGEARHEAARELAELTLAIQAAQRTRELWQEQVSFAQANLDVATKRRRAGDASALDQNIASGDLSEVRRQFATASSELTKLQARFSARYGQELMPKLAADTPSLLVPEESAWKERVLEQSEVLKAAAHQTRIAELSAARAGADRRPDPTVGVHAASESGGSERIVGLTLSIPFGGTYRSALHREALQQVEVARAALEQARRELESEVAVTLAEVRGSIERWRFAEETSVAAAQNAQLSQRAFSLGEVDLQAVLLARRQAVDAALASSQARVDALRARYRLLIDAHLIWNMHED